ncbi:hypothetical protein JW766_02790 [Candidatus Dojkabacteria bacterium]|nr:hypothetical protein [Candidatus Dojkabacteria bacterium]
MKVKIENIIKNVGQDGNSASILISYKDVEEQQRLAEVFAREILLIPAQKPYKTHADVFGIWPENINSKTIKIEQIHEFIRKTQLKPFCSHFKVGIIISSEKMTKESQNALLKTLEEPPKNTFLILTTSNIHKLIPTIISRCQVFNPSEKAGKARDLTTFRKVLESNIIERFKLAEEIVSQKNRGKVIDDTNSLIEDMLTYFREEMIKNKKNTRKTLQIVEIIDLIELTRNAIEKNVNVRLALESLMINLPLRGDD